jgi:hypothetical protein
MLKNYVFEKEDFGPLYIMPSMTWQGPWPLSCLRYSFQFMNVALWARSKSLDLAIPVLCIIEVPEASGFGYFRILIQNKVLPVIAKLKLGRVFQT